MSTLYTGTPTAHTPTAAAPTLPLAGARANGLEARA